MIKVCVRPICTALLIQTLSEKGLPPVAVRPA